MRTGAGRRRHTDRRGSAPATGGSRGHAGAAGTGGRRPAPPASGRARRGGPRRRRRARGGAAGAVRQGRRRPRARPAAGGTGTSGVAVKLDATHQTIQGFGINTALMPGGKTVPVDKLFAYHGSRRNRPVHPSHRHEFERHPHREVRRRGEGRNAALKVIGSTWSPPANCKSNNNTQKGGYLLESCYDSWSTTIANFAQAAGAVRHVDRERVRLCVVRSRRTAVHRRLRHDDVHRQTDGGLGQGGWTEAQGQGRQGHRARSVGMDPRLEQPIGDGLARCQPSAQLRSAEVWMLLEHHRPRHRLRSNMPRRERLRLRPLALEGSRRRGAPSTSSACTSTTRRLRTRGRPTSTVA